MRPPSYILYQRETNLGVVNLSRQRCVFAVIEVVLYVDRIAAHISKHDLIAIPLRRRHLDRIADAVVESEAGLGVPGVGDVDVVVGNGGISADRCERRVQRKVTARIGIGIGYLGGSH